MSHQTLVDQVTHALNFFQTPNGFFSLPTSLLASKMSGEDRERLLDYTTKTSTKSGGGADFCAISGFKIDGDAEMMEMVFSKCKGYIEKCQEIERIPEIIEKKDEK